MKILYTLLLIFVFITIQIQAQLVTTVAGQPEIPGNNDGETFDATFNNPHGIAVGIDGVVYTADRWSHTIRKITLDGMVTTLAGTSGVTGDADGVGTQATFNEPWGLCVDHDGNVFVADTRNNKIRKITPDGTVTTVAGSGNYGTSNGFATAATFGNPTGIEADENGNLYVADHLTHIIRKIDNLGFVTTLAGKPYQMGDADGTGNQASFRRPYGLTLDLNGDILVADEWNHKIRKITPEGVVTTVAGDGSIDSDDGLTTTASFNYPWDMTVDSMGNIFVADGYNYTVRKITPEGQVSTYAGTVEVTGAVDGVGAQAKFSGATAIAMSPITKEIYVGDAYNHLVRTITDLDQGVSLSLISGSSTICQGEQITLNASPSIYTTYHFYLDGQIFQSGSNSILETNNLTEGTHTLQVLALDNNSSFTSNEITILVQAGETPTITAVGATSFFEGDSVILISSFGSDYFWSTGETTPTITVFESGIYTVEVTSTNGCAGTSAPIEITVQSNPDEAVIVINGNTTLCPNETSILTSNSNENNQWLKDGWAIVGATDSTYEVSSAGNYQVQVTHQNGTVVISDPIEITVLSDWDFDFSVSKTTGTADDVFDFQWTTTNNIEEANWDFGDGNTSNDFSPTHQYQDEGTYTITATVRNSEGCEYIVTKTDFVTVNNENSGTGTGNGNGGNGNNPPIINNPTDGDLFIPTAFTPNSDGENDILFVRGGKISQMTFLVFNQWGEEVFISYDQTMGWNGTMNGQNAQNGNYVYMLDYVDDEGIRRKISGRVTLLR